jgi:hypothetical protein
MPEGMLTSTETLFETLPPRHFWQGLSTILPLPPHFGQVFDVEITPNGFFAAY